MKKLAVLAMSSMAVALGATEIAQAAPSESGPYYANCSEAKAAGAAPIYRGEPGYRAKLDRDNDGIACE
ncbi:excalibur calcium-binding domain-containing protein [Nocardia sp. IFM 10818]